MKTTKTTITAKYGKIYKFTKKNKKGIRLYLP